MLSVLLGACGAAPQQTSIPAVAAVKTPSPTVVETEAKTHGQTLLPWRFEPDTQTLSANDGLTLTKIGEILLDEEARAVWVAVSTVGTVIHHVLVLRPTDGDPVVVDTIESVSTQSVSVQGLIIEHRYDSGTEGCLLVDRYDLVGNSLNLLGTKMECGKSS